jgi:hypothetical protein
MPFYRRYFHPGQLRFVTTSTYRRAPVFSSERFCRDFVEAGRADLVIKVRGFSPGPKVNFC